jgi:hypothetical protein
MEVSVFMWNPRFPYFLNHLDSQKLAIKLIKCNHFDWCGLQCGFIGLASTWFPADAHSSGELWRIERERFRVICWPSCLHDGGVKSALGRNGNSCLRCLVTHFSGKPFQRRDSHNKNTRKGSQRKFLSCATLALSTISTRATPSPSEKSISKNVHRVQELNRIKWSARYFSITRTFEPIFTHTLLGGDTSKLVTRTLLYERDVLIKTNRSASENIFIYLGAKGGAVKS